MEYFSLCKKVSNNNCKNKKRTKKQKNCRKKNSLTKQITYTNTVHTEIENVVFFIVYHTQ